MNVNRTFSALARLRNVGGTQNRSIFGLSEGWFDAAFNKVDEERIREVGVDRAAAEWILRCGGGVKWHNSHKFLRDYNSLPAGNFRKLKIEEIDGTDSAIMEESFSLLQDLELLSKITIYNNKYVTDDSMGFLCSYTKDKLKWLKLGKNGQITDKGVLYLRVLKKLEYLHLDSLPGVQHPKKVISELRAALPDCTIEYPPYTDEEVD